MSMTASREASTAWVCTACYEAHHGIGEEWTGETLHPHPDAAFYVEPYTPPEPLCLIDEADDVTAGIMREEHAEDCFNRTDTHGDYECECEQITFSKSSCDGCGSHLAGAREALTIWHKETA